MDVFALRNQLIGDYATYIESFINIQERHIQEHVEQELRGGALWPDPLIQLNPNFEPGEWIDDLVKKATLHPLCQQIFRKDKTADNPLGKKMRLHKHQTDAIEAAKSGDNYVLTTGTGSGKSLAYIIPIVDHVLRRGSGKGIQAIIVYPMNALANSQLNELEKFLCRGFPDGQPPVTFRRYTGQESDEEKQEIIAHPPDILLTNYVMLELVMTRPHEKPLVRATKGLRFLVLDELHTYRGRQGADVAMLVRRVRDACASPDLQCVGTSATLAQGGAFGEQQQRIAEVATSLFGAQVRPERVIGETLRRATPEQDLSDPTFVQALAERVRDPEREPPKDFDEFVNDPLSIWIEPTFGLAAGSESGRLRRATPMSITGENGAARRLAELTALPVARCEEAVQKGLLAGYDVSDPDTGFPVFAFRLHQYISRGDTVYASLEDPDERYITLNGQQFVPRDRQRVLLPLAFCRECGQEYYVVRRITDHKTGNAVFLPRRLRDQTAEEDEERGFLHRNPDEPWPQDETEELDLLPEDWLEMGPKGLRVKRGQRKKRPYGVRLNTLGQEDVKGALYQFVKSPFPFCLNCGVAYGSRERSDFAKLASLSSEGRSTATTVLSLSALRALRQDEALEYKARKLLSFTDNRQDASLQAGHFNDFVEVGLLRAALYRAVQDAGPEGLEHDVLSHRVFEALGLPLELYATDPEVKFKLRKETQRALREVLAYRVYQDLRRGWRVTSPNLEQCGLLRIEYVSLDELSESKDEWTACHPTLATATPEQRRFVAKTLLDFLRRELAIKVKFLDDAAQESIQQKSNQRLVDPWAIDENEEMAHASIAFPRSRSRQDYRGNTFISGRSGFGQFLRRSTTFPNYDAKLTLDDTGKIIRQLFGVLRTAGLVEIVYEATGEGAVHGHQVPADAMLWIADDGTEPFHDPIRMPRQPRVGGRTNPFFVNFYRTVAAQLHGIRAREHTAQVPSDERQKREDAFRKGDLPVLYCSPTMELGVDISQLNVVNMRNVPPTPANYAQRSGRAGRSGQPALVFTYCTSGSPHDQYFFKRPERMVAGSVAPPRLDLGNEDLIRAHVHAVWLAETGQSLGKSLKDVLDLASDLPALHLLESVQDSLSSPRARRRAAQRLWRIMGTLEDELRETDWYDSDWLPRELTQVMDRFDAAGERWRGLYRSARNQQSVQHAIMEDPSRSAADRKQARRLRAEAEAQVELLTDSRNVMQSDFYSYRYFASEGFLPGYNFPRLPLSAYIPARRGRRSDRDEFLSRPRFLAISEFGPQSIIYHEGSRYVTNRVILPVGDKDLLTTSAKLCPACGYLHPIPAGTDGPDLCEYCGILLGNPLRSLFRMQNVSTKRRDRINCDEEERMRMGYELRTGVRFGEYGARPARRVATIHSAGGAELFKLTYGDAATIWRINLGWRRRKEKDVLGFLLDTERGYWESNKYQVEPDPQDPMSPATKRVVPFVQDRRNCLLVEPGQSLDIEIMASLQPALKTAIQVLYQLEDKELAAEPLPALDERRVILLYESAEGGAGVLRQLLNSPNAMGQVARTALEICHFDPDTGGDLRRAPGAKEDCEAACYDCLMSYTNQMDHALLDRQCIKELLLDLVGSTLKASPVAASRQAHLEKLKALCESDLEKKWLDFLEEHNLPLPDAAQRLIETCDTRVDFYYHDPSVAIFIDGTKHDHADVAYKDEVIADCLMMDLGLTVIRFRYDEDWKTICANNAYLFGTVRES